MRSYREDCINDVVTWVRIRFVCTFCIAIIQLTAHSGLTKLVVLGVLLLASWVWPLVWEVSALADRSLSVLAGGSPQKQRDVVPIAQQPPHHLVVPNNTHPAAGHAFSSPIDLSTMIAEPWIDIKVCSLQGFCLSALCCAGSACGGGGNERARPHRGARADSQPGLVHNLYVYVYICYVSFICFSDTYLACKISI